jgi:hypothetical protein
MNELDRQYNFLFYSGKGGSTKIQVFLDSKSETIWTTQKGMGEMFDVEENTITYHLGNIFDTGELVKEATTRKIRVVRQEGSRNDREIAIV